MPPIAPNRNAPASVPNATEGAIAGVLKPADFGEMHVLDDKTARKVPKKMQGRLLSQQEARALLERICM